MEALILGWLRRKLEMILIPIDSKSSVLPFATAARGRRVRKGKDEFVRSSIAPTILPRVTQA